MAKLNLNIEPPTLNFTGIYRKFISSKFALFSMPVNSDSDVLFELSTPRNLQSNVLRKFICQFIFQTTDTQKNRTLEIMTVIQSLFSVIKTT